MRATPRMRDESDAGEEEEEEAAGGGACDGDGS